MKILLLDNYDSFTYNLKSLLETSVDNAEVKVRRNRDKQIFNENFDMLVISPGPMTWKETGILKELFEKKIIPEKIPVLGICLGMQFVAGYYGYEVGMISNPVHGYQAEIEHIDDPLFKNIPANFLVARYNSLGLASFGKEQEKDGPLEFIAFEKDSGSVMALRHKTLPFAGFQFHPESFLTEYGAQLIKNFMELYVENK
ncbi:MAG: aminodeoxychorismate/anthranilate synthase component II [Candidatus Delongbacteria bacterium]|nr:aminodeoxychorismate/anthranilate synthase component II [Candidatus Delongbacteria bacterium]MCG2760724.1 aminodeoxychorismate/anthranilate synthase component II [Candidatus Delongbacteria bacterium]